MTFLRGSRPLAPHLPLMEEDRFEKATREADAERLMAKVKDDAQGNRDAQILTTWGQSLAGRLDPILESYPSMAGGSPDTL